MILDAQLQAEIIDAFIKLSFAAVLGGLIGLERDIKGRPAGLRTHILVAIGTALLMMISIAIYEIFDQARAIDPSRIAAQTITGIGFLGAGAIIKGGVTIRGLTTAGSIWVVAALGLAVGMSYYVPATVATILTLITLGIFGYVERYYRKDSYRILKAVAPNRKNVIMEMLRIIERKNVNIEHFEYIKNIKQKNIEAVFTVRLHHRIATDTYSHDIIEDLEKGIKGLKQVGWERLKDL